MTLLSGGAPRWGSVWVSERSILAGRTLCGPSGGAVPLLLVRLSLEPR